MPAPSLFARIRHALGRAIRETAQALDRTAIRGKQHAETTRRIGDDPYIFDIPLSRHRNVMPLLKRGSPKIDPDAMFIAPCSTIVGNVEIGPGSSVWYGAVLRADRCLCGIGASEEKVEEWKNKSKGERRLQDMERDTASGGGVICIGSGTNVQDGVVVSAREDHAVIGDGVTIGHGAQIHSATVGSHSLIGMGSIINPGAHVGEFSFIAAGAVIGEGVTVPEGQLWVGNPARKLRDLSDEEKNRLISQANDYVTVASTQTDVMELGGNVSDHNIEHLMIGETTTEKDIDEQTENPEQRKET